MIMSQRMRLACIFFALGLLETAQACGGGLEGPGGPTVATTQRPTTAGPTTAPVNSQPYAGGGGGGPIKDCNNDLTCSFDKPCCWQNAKPPRDSLEYVVADSSPQAFNASFPGSSSQPSGKYLTTIGAPKTPTNSTAQFYSCPINCTDQASNVTLRYWQTPGVVLQVCKHAVGQDAAPLTDCKTLPASNQGTPYTVQLPPGQNWEVVVVSSNFGQTPNTEDRVAFDDLRVQAGCCKSGPADGGLCCNFDQGNTCGYSPSGGKPFAVQQKSIGNMDTGVFKPADGSSGYAGVVLNPGESAQLGSQPVAATSAKQLKFKYYDATEGIVFKCCINDPSTCPFQSNPTVSPASRQWQEATCPVDPNTKKVFFVAQNTKNNIGSVGLDQVTALDGNGQNLCSSGPGGSSGGGVFN